MKLPNRTGTVYRLGGKRRRPWIARTYNGRDEYGVRQYKTLGYYATKTDATKALLEYNENPYDIEKRKATLQDVFDLMVEEKRRDVKEQTIKGNYTSPFERFFAPLKKETFADLRHFHFQKILDEYAEEGKKATYLAKPINLVGQLYKTALLNDIVSVDYSKGLKNRGANSDSQPFFTEDELLFILSQIGTVKDADVVGILCLTGLRPSELLQIRKENIDTKLHMVRKVGIKTKAGKQKRVPIADAIYPALMERHRQAKEYLFADSNGYQMDYWHFLDYVYSPALERLSLEYRSPKACRHTFANITFGILESKERTSIIGHSDERITNEVYTDIEDHKLVNAFKKVEKSLTKV